LYGTLAGKLRGYLRSPDGRWLTYGSNEGGGTNMYVRPFLSGTGKWQIPTASAAFSAGWRAD